ncbi:MAG: cysteine desulfurase [Ruminococcus sp.]|nr:cysteine desulfurase [Ruminococcus sp.]
MSITPKPNIPPAARAAAEQLNNRKRIYADNAASMPVSERALAAAMPYFRTDYANPSAVHTMGMNAASALLAARRRTAAALGADAREIVFTSGGTESDNHALRAAAVLGAEQGRRHIVTTAMEHHAVLNCCKALEKQGFTVTYLPPDSEGFVTASQVAAALTDDTCLVSIMLANNEIGTLQPVREIAAVCRERGVLLHTDAVQAAGHIAIDVKALGADMLSFSGHKFGAMKGVGGLYVRQGISLPPYIIGGPQEYGRRAGTEPLPQIVSLAEALTESLEGLDEKNARMAAHRDRLIDALLEIPDSRLNGSRENRLAGNVNISFAGLESESLVLMLDMQGISASGGSACTSGTDAPSHVLTAIGTPPGYVKGSLRLSISHDLTDADTEHIITAVKTAVEKLRRLSV